MQVRTTMINGEPWFVAKDVCEVLGISNHRDAISRLDHRFRDEVGVSDAIGRTQSTLVLNEPGLYKLTFRSNKQEAEKFGDWVSIEVLPSIRKHGAYMTTETIEKTLSNPDFIIGLATKLKEEQAALREAESVIAAQQQKLKEQEAPVAIYNLAITAGNTLSMNEVAKSLNTGRTRLYKFLRDEKVIMQDSTLPFQRFVDAGYFKVTERPRASGDTVVVDPATRVTAKGFDYVAKLFTRRTGA
jgi:prophage antirepressor-like protein